LMTHLMYPFVVSGNTSNVPICRSVEMTRRQVCERDAHREKQTQSYRERERERERNRDAGARIDMMREI